MGSGSRPNFVSLLLRSSVTLNPLFRSAVVRYGLVSVIPIAKVRFPGPMQLVLFAPAIPVAIRNVSEPPQNQRLRTIDSRVESAPIPLVRACGADFERQVSVQIRLPHS